MRLNGGIIYDGRDRIKRDRYRMVKYSRTSNSGKAVIPASDGMGFGFVPGAHRELQQ